MPPACLNKKKRKQTHTERKTRDAYINTHSPTADQRDDTAVITVCEAHKNCSGSLSHARGPQARLQSNVTKKKHVRTKSKLLTPFSLCSARRGFPDPASRAAPLLLLGDFKHAKALVLLQQFIFGPDLLPQALQLLLLLLRADADAGHGADQLPHLLELVFEFIQHLVNILAVLVHAAEERKQRHYSHLLLERCLQPDGGTAISSVITA